MSNKKLIWKTEQRRVRDLLAFKKNPRRMSEKQTADLTASLEKFGLVEIPAIDTNNRIVAGHQRIAVLQLLGRGDELIDVRIPNRKLSKAEYESYLLTSNRVTGSWDYDILSEYFDLDTLMVSGFDDTDLSVIFADSLEVTEDDFDVEEAVKEILKPKSKTGDLYALGSHRLLVGDSLDLENVRRVVGNTQIDIRPTGTENSY